MSGLSLRRIAVFSALIVLLFYGGLILSLFWFFDTIKFRELLFSKRTLFSLQISLFASVLAAILAIGLAIPAAYALSRYRFVGHKLVDILLEFPLIISPASLGAILLIFFNNPLGTWLQENTIRFVFTFAGIVLAQFVATLGIAVRMVKTVMDEIPPEMDTIARTLGAKPIFAFFTITLPLARKGILAAFILVWAKALGEFGTTITVAGTMAMRTETLPIAIYMRLATAEIEGTVALIFILIGIGLSALFLARIALGKDIYRA
jgi:molybdate transport system permease protein